MSIKKVIYSMFLEENKFNRFISYSINEFIFE